MQSVKFYVNIYGKNVGIGRYCKTRKKLVISGSGYLEKTRVQIEVKPKYETGVVLNWNKLEFWSNLHTGLQTLEEFEINFILKNDKGGICCFSLYLKKN